MVPELACLTGPLRVQPPPHRRRGPMPRARSFHEMVASERMLVGPFLDARVKVPATPPPFPSAPQRQSARQPNRCLADIHIPLISHRVGWETTSVGHRQHHLGCRRTPPPKDTVGPQPNRHRPILCPTPPPHNFRACVVGDRGSVGPCEGRVPVAQARGPPATISIFISQLFVVLRNPNRFSGRLTQKKSTLRIASTTYQCATVVSSCIWPHPRLPKKNPEKGKPRAPASIQRHSHSALPSLTTPTHGLVPVDPTGDFRRILPNHLRRRPRSHLRRVRLRVPGPPLPLQPATPLFLFRI